MKQVFLSPSQPDAAAGGTSGAPEGETSASSRLQPTPPSTLLSQRISHLQIKLTSEPSDPALANLPTETDELQAQLREARQSIVQWTRAELAWNGQRRLFKIMTENVSDMIAVVDEKGNRVWNNPAYGNLLGYTAEQLAGTHVLNEAHPDDKTRAHVALIQAIQTGSMQQADFRAKRQDGGWIDLQARIVPIRDSANRVETLVFTAHDVTEKKRLTEALNLAKTSETTAGVVESMARNLDQIVTAAVGNLSIAKNLNGSQNAVAVRLNEIERSLTQVRALVEQLGTISGHPDHARVRTIMEPLVQETVHAALRGTMVRAEFLFPRRMPEVDLEVEAFTHALRNIVANSVQAMDKGVIRISADFLAPEQISRQAALKPGSYIRLTLQDQGHGMSEKTLAHAFEPYFTTRTGAQGLGLATALSAVQRQGGTIDAESTPGVGTTVHIYLPAVAGTFSASTTAPESLAKKRILLMDDEQMILDIVSRMLGHLGYEVKTCLDGAAAIAAFTKAKEQGQPFDVVLMDLIIPKGIGGQDAVNNILLLEPHAKVIASSGHLDHPVMLDHKKFGFRATLEKPYKLERLQQVIESVIEQGS